MRPVGPGKLFITFNQVSSDFGELAGAPEFAALPIRSDPTAFEIDSDEEEYPMNKGSAAVSLAAAVGVMAVSAALTSACGSANGQDTAAPNAARSPAAPTASVASGPTSTVTTGEPKPATGASTTPARSDPVPAGNKVCPVQADVLMTALRTSTSDIYSRAGKPNVLQDVVCYRMFATAGTVPDGKSQPVHIVFGFDAAARVWRPLNLGSASYCAGFVPDDVAAQLPGC
jgi:hypothetical protein